MVRPRVAEEAPVRVAQRHVRGGGHVRDVQPHGDVGQRGALDLVQRARVAQAQGVVDHVVLRRPRVDRQASALVRSNHHVVVVHAQDGGAHAVDEPDGLVEVLGQDHPRAREEGRLERRLGHELAADVVVHSLFFALSWASSKGCPSPARSLFFGQPLSNCSYGAMQKIVIQAQNAKILPIGLLRLASR